MTPPHIFLISLETLRKDHLGCYGARREVSPNLDRLADEGVRFRDSYVNCGWTLPQHMTLMTGLYPTTHGIELWDNRPLHEDWKMLAEHLKEQGYQTFAGVSNRNRFGGGGASDGLTYGFQRGFDEHRPDAEYNQHMPWTEEFVVERFRQHHEKGPVFVYVHINDTHEPFQPPEPWYGMWGQSYRNKYEGQISYVDHYLGRIFAAMKDMGVYDETLIVAFSDHGTEFWEHEFLEKKCNLYREIMDVPLIFRYPKAIPAGRVVDGLVESVDVLPTLLDAAGLPPMTQAQKPSLMPRVLGQSDDSPEFIVAHTVHNHQKDFGPPQFDHWALQTRDLKFIRSHLHAEPDELHSDWKQRFQSILARSGQDPAGLEKGLVIRELYDHRADPEEHRSLLGPGRSNEVWPRFPYYTPVESIESVAADLEAKLDKWIEETTGAAKD